MNEIAFSRVLRVEPLPRDGLTQDIEANAEERAAVARLNGLPDVARLQAHFRIAKWRRGVQVEGEVRARVTQTCVVSLERFEVEIDEPVEVKFLPVDENAPAADPLADDDAPDPLIDGRIDLGALAGEFLTLALDPYPRKPGVEFAPPADTAGDASPFAALRGLKEE